VSFSNGQLVQAADLNNFSVTTVTTSGAITSGGTTTAAALTVTGASTLADVTATGTIALNGTAIGIGNDASDTVTVTGTVVGMPLKTYTETRTAPAIGGGALALDIANGTVFKVALNANCTVTISNPPASGRWVGITVIFTADGTIRTITWPASVVWAAGVAPTMTGTNNKRDIITLCTEDGGTTYFGIIVGQSY
jgi:hypothetical protein